VVGGLKAAIFTATEASVVAVAYALVVGGLVYRELTPKRFFYAFRSAVVMSAAVMFLVAAAGVTGWLITVAQIPFLLVDFLEPLIETPRLLMLVVVVLVLIIGMVMDFVPTVLILTPVLMPLVKIAGIDPVYFGVLFVMATAVGLLTPPVGVVLNVACGIGKLSIEQGARGVLPFILAKITLLLLLVAFPELILTPFRWIAGSG